MAVRWTWFNRISPKWCLLQVNNLQKMLTLFEVFDCGCAACGELVNVYCQTHNKKSDQQQNQFKTNFFVVKQ